MIDSQDFSLGKETNLISFPPLQDIPSTRNAICDCRQSMPEKKSFTPSVRVALRERRVFGPSSTRRQHPPGVFKRRRVLLVSQFLPLVLQCLPLVRLLLLFWKTTGFALQFLSDFLSERSALCPAWRVWLASSVKNRTDAKCPCGRASRRVWNGALRSRWRLIQWLEWYDVTLMRLLSHMGPIFPR